MVALAVRCAFAKEAHRRGDGAARALDGRARASRPGWRGWRRRARMKLGWIGVGSIGGSMVLRALGAGHTVLAYARGARLEEIKAAGAKVSSDYAEVGAFADVLGVCVFHDGQVREALLDKGALAAMRPGSVLANHTTGGPDFAQELAAAAPAGVEVLDAAFSGGAGAVDAGQLSLLIGGTEEGLDRARPVLSTYADRLNHLGGHGRGMLLKLLNNVLFCVNARYAYAALDLAGRQGFAPQDVVRVLHGCSAQSFSLDMFSGAPDPARLIDRTRAYIRKDAQAALDAAGRMGLDMTPFSDAIAFYGSAK
jgi:3-hydroxyisobutyrate dehydrogenase-like beta-hydroxyacid dehydrogenase